MSDYETDPTCLLCGAAEENVLHFILQCEKLHGKMSSKIMKILLHIKRTKLLGSDRDKIQTTMKKRI